MLSARYLTDDGVRSLPIACRLVPYDQWLVTHVDTSWKVKDVKQYFLSKCDAWGSATAPQAPRFRPASPVTFSAPSRRSSLDSDSWTGTTEDDDDDDDWDTYPENERRFHENSASESGYSADTSRNASGRTLPSSSSTMSFQFGPRRAHVNDFDDAQAATIARYVVVSFSNGFMLDDEMMLTWYNLRPLELLELHNAGSIVALPRKALTYAEPYFESLVRVPEHSSTSRRMRGNDDQSQAHTSEWKPRWAIIRDGILHLSKDAHSAPTHRYRISSLNKLSGPDQVGIQSSSSCIVCAKFNRSINQNTDNGDTDGMQVLHRKQKQKTGSWIILEMPDKNSYESILRVLYRLGPSHLTSPKASLPSPELPLSPTQSHRQSIALPPNANHSTTSSSNPMPFLGVQYPEWRLALLAKARMAGRGATSSAVSLAHASCLVGERADRTLIHHPLPRAPSISEGLRRKAAEELVSGSEDEEIETTSASPWIDALSEEDDDADESDGDVESEIEWDGWMRDLARKARRAPPPISILNKSTQSTIHLGMPPMSPSSPTSSDYDYDMCESSGGPMGRPRTLSYAHGSRREDHDSGGKDDLHLQRTRSNTVYPGRQAYTSTTTTVITTYVDRVPDIYRPAPGPSRSRPKPNPSSNGHHHHPHSPTATSHSSGGLLQHPNRTPSSSTLSTVSARSASRGQRTRSPSNSSLSRTSSATASLPTTSSTPPDSRVGSSSGASFASSASRSGIGGVKRIVRGVSIRNAFSTERLARGFENALDFVDGR